jgi:hypothetical protein
MMGMKILAVFLLTFGLACAGNTENRHATSFILWTMDTDMADFPYLPIYYWRHF